MKRLYVILLFVIICSVQNGYCQIDTLNGQYYSSLKAQLSKDENVKKIKFIQEKIYGNKGIIQSMYVKLKDDSNDRFWRVGKEFIYNCNTNRLGFISNTDVKTLMPIDTSFSYQMDGQIGRLEIYTLKYDSVVVLKRGNGPWSGIVGNYYEKMPNVFKTIEYSCSRDTIIESIYKYSGSNGFVIDGDVIYRDKNMSIIKTKHYEMGMEVALIDKKRKGVLIDSRDGQSYPTIQIGDQIWMAKNMSYKPTEGKCWEYEDGYAKKCGYLYNWETSQNVCPMGWRLPSKQDFDTLYQHAGGDDVKVTTELSPSGSSGFFAVDGVLRFGINYTPTESGTAFWSSTESSKRYAWGLTFGRLKTRTFVDKDWYKNYGLYVRCLKNNIESKQ
jgi:uncharacterized protein (TIGR02145 family)